MLLKYELPFWFLVALLAEGVDRNRNRSRLLLTRLVALLAEGVDRNCRCTFPFLLRVQVALLAEGVDRNKPSALVAAVLWCRPPRGGRG